MLDNKVGIDSIEDLQNSENPQTDIEDNFQDISEMIEDLENKIYTMDRELISEIEPFFDEEDEVYLAVWMFREKRLE